MRVFAGHTTQLGLITEQCTPLHGSGGGPWSSGLTSQAGDTHNYVGLEAACVSFLRENVRQQGQGTGEKMTRVCLTMKVSTES